jgi:hypothetical protein
MKGAMFMFGELILMRPSVTRGHISIFTRLILMRTSVTL